MNKFLSTGFLVLVILLNGCSNEQTQNNNTSLSATVFADKISQLPAATILDVRTPDEYSKGHLTNALNYDWNGNDFEKQIASLDKTKPVFVYCLSGGRSASAAQKMRLDGFKEVYELKGGIMKWRAAGFSETTDNNAAASGMTKQEFERLLNSEKLVLVDFYADWCEPCKKMEPYLNEIAKQMADKVVLIRINADNNQTLCKELKIDALPVLQLYKSKTLEWENTGFIEKSEVLNRLQ